MPNFAPAAARRSQTSPKTESAAIVVLKIFLFPFIAINVVKKSDSASWKIEHQCPQCGAPVILEETDHLLACGYCRVRLWLYTRGLFSYCFVPRSPPMEKIWFIPYWRFKGLAFSCNQEQVRHRFVDTTLCGVNFPPLPRSLGFRPQALSLKPAGSFAGSLIDGAFARPSVIPSAMRDRFLPKGHPRPSASQNRRESHQAFIGEALSLVHTPVYEKNGKVWDALLNRPLDHNSSFQVKELLFPERTPPPLTFLPVLCPQCGWDLEGSSRSVAMVCRNCQSAWCLSQGNMKWIPFGVPSQWNGDQELLPFWQLKFQFAGIELNTLEDLHRLANTSISRQNSTLLFWIPAFKLPPRLFLQAARRATLSSFMEFRKEDLPPVTIHSATLALEEAAQCVKILLASLAVPRRRFMERMDSFSAKLEEATLSFVPFSPKAHEFVQPHLPLSVPRRALYWKRFI